MLDRSWAVGLSQPEFEKAYLQRNPFADVIPNGEEWSKLQEREYDGYKGVSPEDYKVADGPETPKEEKPKVYSCRGCGRVFNHHLGRTAHERRCKVKIAKEAQE